MAKKNVLEVRLWEIGPEIARFEAYAEEKGGELDENDLARELDLREAAAEKISSTIGYVKNLELSAMILKAEADKLAARAKARENQAEKIRKYMLACGVSKFKNEFHSTYVMKTKKLLVGDESKIPNEFKRHVPESWEIDKNLVKKLIDQGNVVPECTVEDGQTLVIK